MKNSSNPKLLPGLSVCQLTGGMWGSPPPGDSFWKMVDKAGFKTHVYNKNSGNKEKKADVAIATAMMDGRSTSSTRTTTISCWLPRQKQTKELRRTCRLRADFVAELP
ncbi:MULTISPECIES: hypothetical protein [Bradyrhizobium]|uniref:Beta-ketoacyl synthase, N-terminal domain n=2 Tax=Nitrobacteraceae TaxID=41294 RepID=A0ABV4GJS2_9BRAD|nr:MULTISPECIES: hypothetical protein [unclassified Bradyrhizobium]